jgi:hypothetical protein
VAPTFFLHGLSHVFYRPDAEQVLQILGVEPSPTVLRWFIEHTALVPEKLWHLQGDWVLGGLRAVEPILPQKVAAGAELAEREG